MTGAKKDDSDSSNFRLIVAPVKTGVHPHPQRYDGVHHLNSSFQRIDSPGRRVSWFTRPAPMR